MGVENANWNDLKYFLALARHKRYSHAAASLQTTHVTMANTIKRLENAMEQRLFIQTKEGFKLTHEGTLLLPIAEECERQIRLPSESIGSTMVGHRPRVRIGTVEGIGNSYLAKRLSNWLLNNPIELELATLPKQSQISRRDADICITLEHPSGQNLIAQLLTPYKLGIFASAGYLSSSPEIRGRNDLKDHDWIGYVDKYLFSKTLDYCKEIASDLRFSFRSTSMVTQIEAAIAGMGLAILPLYMIYDHLSKQKLRRKLVRVLPEIEFDRKYWISASTDLHRFSFIYSVWNFIKDTARTDRDIFLGSRGIE